MLEAEIYKALGDPTRLEIIRRLTSQEANTIGELSADLGVSRQGARKQIQVLVDANVVHLSRKGRETHVSLNAQKLAHARRFISYLENQWDNRLAKLKKLVES